MKTCSKCKTEYPHTAEYFVRASKERSGLGYTCRACARAAVRASKERNPERYRHGQADHDRHAANREQILARKRERYASNPRAANQRSASWRKVHPERHRAQARIHSAIKRGDVTPWPACAVPECVSTRPEAHHADYGRPLDVVWLCRSHHQQAHALFRSLVTV